MSKRASNVSFDGQPIEIELKSKYLVLIDPLALDGLADILASLPAPDLVDPRDSIAPYSSPLRIGVHEVDGFRPGKYRLGASDFTRADAEDDTPEVFDIDTGTVVVIDFGYLGRVAKQLTWEQYDQALQMPIGDDSVFLAITEQIGGEFYAVIGADSTTEFVGDGSYRLKSGTPTRLE